MQVFVRDNNVDQALKALKKKMQREGVFRETKLGSHYEKPSERKARERAEAPIRTASCGSAIPGGRPTARGPLIALGARKRYARQSSRSL